MKRKSPPKTLQRGGRVVCYVRDSGGSRQVKSVDDQLSEIRTYCAENGLMLIREFADRARTGTTINKRFQLQQMQDFCRVGNYAEGLIIWNFSRLGRNKEEVEEIKKDLRKCGLVICSIKEPIPEGSIGSVIEGLYDWQAEETSVKISEDTKRGLSHRVQSGFVPGGGTPPRGYRAKREIISYDRDGKTPRIGTTWEVDPELGPLVTLAFKMRAEGRSLTEITNSPAGILYKTKAGWVTFFLNESYLGIIKCGDTKIENHATIPPLVDRETFDAVQRLRKIIGQNEPGSPLHPRRYHSPSLFSGFATCIHCGKPILREVCGAARTKDKRWLAYVCSAKKNINWHACEGKQIKAEPAERAVINAVLNEVLTPERAAEILAHVQKIYSDNGEMDRQEDTARAALTSCEKSIARLLDTIETTESATAKERLKDRENEKARLQFELSIITAQRKAAQLEITPEVIADTLAIWRGEIEAARDENDIRGLQRFLKRFITRIELGYFIARLWYTFRPDAFSGDAFYDLRVSQVGTA